MDKLDLLETAGFILQDADASDHPCVDGRYDGDALAEKLQFLRAGVSEPATPIANVITFKELNLRRTTDRAALLALYRKIATGEIKAVRWSDGAPLSHAEFDEAEIAGHLKQAGAARSWTAGEVATITGWKPECVAHWCQIGVLQAERSMRGAIPAWQISETALAEFNRSYSVVSDLAKQSRRSSRALLRRLSDLGIATTGAKPVGSTSRGHLVRQEDLLKSLLPPMADS